LLIRVEGARGLQRPTGSARHSLGPTTPCNDFRHQMIQRAIAFKIGGSKYDAFSRRS
jgi:hypothetical protein